MLIAAVTAAVVLAGRWAVRHFREFGKHAGSGGGALTVAQLLDQADAEDVSGGRHRLRERRYIRMSGDLSEELALVETRLLPPAETGLPLDDMDVMARYPWTLRHVYNALQRL
nr:hypothetical protein [Saccharopolyspora spinosa]